MAPLQGQREGLEALDQAGAMGESWRLNAPPRLLRAPAPSQPRTLPEFEAKAVLADAGVPVPRSRRVAIGEAAAAAAELGLPVVMKAAGAAIAHKSEVGGVVLGIRDIAAASAAATQLAALGDAVLVEEMIVDGVAEVLAGVIVDPQFGLTLVIGAGGVLTELLRDSVSLLPPFTEASVRAALARLKMYPLLQGFRGRPRADVPALVAAILRIAHYAEQQLGRLVELDVNPLIVRPEGAGVVAVDALIRIGKET